MPRRASDLTLHEEIVLLALRDEKGTVESRASMHAYAIAGAILSELALVERVRLVTEGKKTFVEPADTRPTGDEVADECLAKIAGAKRRRQASDWVMSLASLRRLRHRVAVSLCRRGVLREDEGKILLFFTRKLYPTIDPVPERRLVARMEEAIFGGAEQIDPRTAIVVALAHATGMLPIHFEKSRLKGRKERIEKILKGEMLGAATRSAVQAAQAAVMAASSVAIIAATTVVHH